MVRRRWATALGVAATTSAGGVLGLLPDGVAFSVSAWCVHLAAVIYLVWASPEVSSHRTSGDAVGFVKADAA